MVNVMMEGYFVLFRGHIGYHELCICVYDLVVV